MMSTEMPPPPAVVPAIESKMNWLAPLKVVYERVSWPTVPVQNEESPRCDVEVTDLIPEPLTTEGLARWAQSMMGGDTSDMLDI